MVASDLQLMTGQCDCCAKLLLKLLTIQQLNLGFCAGFTNTVLETVVTVLEKKITSAHVPEPTLIKHVP